MTRGRWAVGGAVALLAAVAGCVSQADLTHSSAWLDRVRGVNGPPLPADALVLQTTLLDRPAPDAYLATGLWNEATVTNPIPADLSALLQVNGLRARVITGVAPARFLAMVADEHSTISPMARACEPGKTKVVPVNGPLDKLSMQVQPDLKSDRTTYERTGAECGLATVAKPTGDGRIVLRCEPSLQHGDRQSWLKPTADGVGFARSEQKPLDPFPTLAFEVTLAPDDYLIVGPFAEPTASLGHAFFYVTEGDRVRQRVLVIKASRAVSPVATAGVARTSAAAAAMSGTLVRGTAE